MAVSTQIKNRNAEIVKKFGKTPSDTGLPESQIALMTARINELTDHFKRHPKDHHSERGLLKLVGKRRRVLSYLRNTDDSRYLKVIKELELRK